MKLSGEYFVQVKYNRDVGFSGGLSVEEYSSDIIDFNFDGSAYELIQYIKYSMSLEKTTEELVVLCMVKGG